VLALLPLFPYRTLFRSHAAASWVAASRSRGSTCTRSTGWAGAPPIRCSSTTCSATCGAPAAPGCRPTQSATRAPWGGCSSAAAWPERLAAWRRRMQRGHPPTLRGTARRSGGELGHDLAQAREALGHVGVGDVERRDQAQYVGACLQHEQALVRGEV